MQKGIYNAKTKEVVIEEMTPGEVAEIEKLEAEAEAERQAKEQAEAERQAKLESAKAKLAALGLDNDEVNAILGISG